MAVTIMEMITRTPLLMLLTSTIVTSETYSDSIFALLLHFAAAVSSLAIAMTLLTSFGIEIMLGLQKQAETDPLTGLKNRGGFLGSVQKRLQSSKVANAPVCVLVCDIDHFKKINDTYGHAAGDSVLVHMAAIMQDVSRKEDIIGRIGGEEFCILLPNSTTEMAKLLAEAIRTEFRYSHIEAVEGAKVSLSIGLARLQPGETYDDCFKRADAALYDAKNNGRDCVMLAPQDRISHAATAA